jgi:hypothetical protein
MLSHVEADERSNEIDVLLTKMAADGSLKPDQMRRLEQAMDDAGPLDRRLAAKIFHANRCMDVGSDEWVERYLGVLSSFFLAPSKDGIVLSREMETCLLTWLGEGVDIANLAERRLAVRILLKAANRPEGLQRRVFKALENNILHQEERWLEGGKRQPGVIDQLDMHLVQRLLLGQEMADRPHAGSGCLPSDVLLSLTRHAADIADITAWRRLLKRAESICSTDSRPLHPNVHS